VASDVYIFNASNDSALACDSLSYSPTKFVKCFENDLATLPMLFASKNDIVLVEDNPSGTFIDQMHSLGIELPHFITKAAFFKQQSSLKYQLNAIRPWGWSRTVHTIFRSVKHLFLYKSPCSEWNPMLRQLSGRQTAADVLKYVLLQQNPLYIDASAVSQSLQTLDAIPDLFMLRNRWVLKSPWSSSGRGLMRISPTLFDSTEKTWAHGVIKEQGFVMIEPWFEKVFDFSILFSVTKEAVSFLCFSHFKTNDKGQFLGSFVHWNNDNLLLELGIEHKQLEMLVTTLSDAIKMKGFQNYYEGWIGVDAMIVRENGKLLIHPCVEINCRYTIGHLAYALRKYCIDLPNALLRIGSIDEYNDIKAKSVFSKPITSVNDKTMFVAWIEGEW